MIWICVDLHNDAYRASSNSDDLDQEYIEEKFSASGNYYEDFCYDSFRLKK